ncbi:MAG: methyltransferase domain-containing protein [Chitinophagaceae bacterium]
MDKDDIPFADIRQNMEELAVINRRLGGHNITIKGIKAVLKNSGLNKPARIVELGCGGGDSLRVLKDYFHSRQLKCTLTGIDINKQCIAFAKEQAENSGINFICSDYRNVEFPEKPHVIFSSLFCHHFTNEELIKMVQWKFENCLIGFFINDLRRHPVAYHFIKLLTRFFSKSYLVKHDGPLSVKRAFIQKDWHKILGRAGIWDYETEKHWAYRWLVTCKKLHT